jgi:hypothetical protein
MGCSNIHNRYVLCNNTIAEKDRNNCQCL